MNTPKKPTHADMDLLEKVLQGQDAAAEGDQPLRDMQPLDELSVMYAAYQRSLRAMQLSVDDGLLVTLAATWLDGFCAGAESARRKALKA